jgi:hypothetical protein
MRGDLPSEVLSSNLSTTKRGKGRRRRRRRGEREEGEVIRVVE